MGQYEIHFENVEEVLVNPQDLELLQQLEPGKHPDVETHLIMSSAGKRTLTLETDYSVEDVERLADRVHPVKDIAASISSGSYRTLGMVVAPCSMKTLSGIALSYADNLLLAAGSNGYGHIQDSVAGNLGDKKFTAPHVGQGV